MMKHMPSRKKAVKEMMEGEELLHEHLEEKLHKKGGKMPKKKRGIEIEVEIEMEPKKRVKKPILKKKMKRVMKEYKEGKLHSGSKKGPVVTNPKQAEAIAYSEARRAKKKKK